MGTVICIDYGTSMSKVGVSLEGGAPFPIPLGECEGDPVKEFPMDSSILFGADGEVYFGSLSVKRSLEVQGALQRRLDSLKRRLTTGEQSELEGIPLPREFNRTGTDFSIAEAIALMFAHILRLTHDYLRRHYEDDVFDDVVYRFTRPVFDPDRGRWVDRHMRAAITAALQLEGRLGKSYAGSIAAGQARRLLDTLELKPSVLRQVSTEGLLEPVAAGILILSQVPNRRFLAAIMDIGAGTTDIALFAGIQPDGMPTVDRVHTYGTPVSLTKGGDHIDQILRRVIEDGTKGSLSARDRIEIELNIRRWKEDIFKFQESIPTLSGGRRLARIMLHNFRKEKAMQEMQQELIDSLLGVLRSAKEIIDEFATLMGPPLYRPVDTIEIIPCGGGANLPVFKEIVGRHWEAQPSGKKLGFDVRRPVPADGGNYDESFPQLAVALGGALSDQPVVNGPAPKRAVRMS